MATWWVKRDPEAELANPRPRSGVLERNLVEGGLRVAVVLVAEAEEVLGMPQKGGEAAVEAIFLIFSL